MEKPYSNSKSIDFHLMSREEVHEIASQSKKTLYFNCLETRLLTIGYNGGLRFVWTESDASHLVMQDMPTSGDMRPAARYDWDGRHYQLVSTDMDATETFNKIAEENIDRVIDGMLKIMVNNEENSMDEIVLKDRLRISHGVEMKILAYYSSGGNE